MNIASIDIGSNTVLLLIVKIDHSERFIPIHNEYEMPRLSKGLNENGEINKEALERFYIVLAKYSKLIKLHHCEKVLARATNALRIAVNSDEIKAEVKEKFAIDIEIISGDEEARLSYLGAASSLPDEEQKFVLDIGGGSTELIYGKQEQILFSKSHPVGAVMLTEKFIQNDPPLKDELQNIRKYLENIFADIPKHIPDDMNGIAVAGTPTSLAAMIQGIRDYEEGKLEGYFLKIDDLTNMISTLSNLKSEEILKRFGAVVKGREDVITAGAIILQTVGQIIGVSGFTVSGRGIRYGTIIRYLNER